MRTDPPQGSLEMLFSWVRFARSPNYLVSLFIEKWNSVDPRNSPAEMLCIRNFYVLAEMKFAGRLAV